MNKTMSGNIQSESCTIITKVETLGDREIKVAIHIPENVFNRRQKINKIYEILAIKS
jgi:hypothetical protein